MGHPREVNASPVNHGFACVVVSSNVSQCSHLARVRMIAAEPGIGVCA